jgi:hypothetical protein
MTDERFEEFLRNALDDLDPVPAPPREAMWAQIDEARRFSRRSEQKSRRVWLGWGIGLAAMLALGVGLGRMTARQQLPAVAPTQVAASGGVTPNRTTYQVAVAQHLSRAEVLLTSFRAQAGSTAPDPNLAQLAGDLLTSTRLLLDSPAGDDPKFAALLGDLELILAQIAGMTKPSAEEQESLPLPPRSPRPRRPVRWRWPSTVRRPPGRSRIPPMRCTRVRVKS